MQEVREIIQNGIQRDRNQRILGAVLSILCGGLICGSIYLGKWEHNSFFAVVGFLLLLVGVRLIYSIKEWNPKRARLLSIITKRPKDIVWVYSVLTENMPYGFKVFSMGSFYFKMADGREFCLDIPTKDLKHLSELLNPLLPHASFGYSEEKDQWYEANPALLYKDQKKNKED